jgi:hypothetical protein
MSKQKGTQKTGGRTKGTPNKTTSDLREWINLVLNDNKEQFEADLNSLEPYKRVLLYEKLLSYVVSKNQSIEIDTKNQITDIRIEVVKPK